MRPLKILTLILAATGGQVFAQETAETDVPAGLSVELNAQADAEGGCLLTFVVSNTHPQPIDAAVFETVLFDAAGQVDRLTLFDFGTLPAGRPRVRQFQIGGMQCDNLGQVLINGASTCTVEGVASDACGTLELNSRTGTELIG